MKNRRGRKAWHSNAVNEYITLIKKDKTIVPCFNTFYEFIKNEYRMSIDSKKVREKDFDIDNFLFILEPFYKGGEYDYLLNSDEELDLLNKRFIVFEIDKVKDNPVLFPIITIIIMEVFINKMRFLLILLFINHLLILMSSLGNALETSEIPSSALFCLISNNAPQR
jgi:hypothetical protein